MIVWDGTVCDNLGTKGGLLPPRDSAQPWQASSQAPTYDGLYELSAEAARKKRAALRPKLGHRGRGRQVRRAD